MGLAIIDGIVKSRLYCAEDIIASEPNEKTRAMLSERLRVNTTYNNKSAAKSDMVFLCVKPNVIYDVIGEIKDAAGADTVFVSIAAGQSIEKLENAFGRPVKLIRVMPNTPALVGEGMAALSPNQNVKEDEIKKAADVFNACGKAEIVPEKLLDAVTGVSGSSPAYTFMFIEALADAAVQGGISRSQAYTFAAQAVMGSAKMVLETRLHPAILKDQVCSPAGTTIDAVAALERNGFRGAVMEAVKVCIDKSRIM